jgi:NAD-dependent SIR2 family protein deacetylase
VDDLERNEIPARIELPAGGDSTTERDLDRAAEIIAAADALVITAGAGMGVDSGLPDFRGTEGFWRAYPPISRLGLRFEEMANPAHFLRDPSLAWGFYGHRLELYRKIVPHRGFQTLRRWAEGPPGGAFVFTSNVDGHFQRAGFAEARVVECHGSILHLQCTVPCAREIWSADEVGVEVDEETFRAAEPLPSCPFCGAVARPNVLMFGDWNWISGRTSEQETRFRTWLEDMDGRLAVIEFGAGTAVPTVRLTSEHLARRAGARLVRVNPREPAVPEGSVSLPMTALEAIDALESRLDAGPSERMRNHREGRLEPGLGHGTGEKGAPRGG